MCVMQVWETFSEGIYQRFLRQLPLYFFKMVTGDMKNDSWGRDGIDARREGMDRKWKSGGELVLPGFHLWILTI
jgi:hypothetical protein